MNDNNYNVFKLEISDNYSNLVGYKYGSRIFKKQVKSHIDYNKKITIIFPPFICNISTTFIQGFFENFVCNLGISGINKYVDVIATGIPNVKVLIIKKLSL